MKTLPNDQFNRYFTEKIWEMIPAIYRHEDGLGANPGVLRALVEVMAEQAVILRRSQDRLWEDQFIDLCNDWAVPYIADLLGTRLISVLNKRGRRVDVAKTIYYRRRKGTPRILEELISDISGWDGKLLESFQRLGRARHGLDPQPIKLAGRFTGTLPGGWADLRQPRGSELADGPFDEYFHTPDVRRQRGLDGRYGISKLAFYLYRLVAYKAEDVTPFSLGDGLRFTFDPSGRDIPLFARRKRPEKLEDRRLRPQNWERERSQYEDWEQWRSAFEWELPTPIRCRLLGHAEYRISEAVIQRLVDDHGLSVGGTTDLRTLRGWQLRDEARLRATLMTFASQAELLSPAIFIPLLRYALVAECGKRALLPDTTGPIRRDSGSLVVAVGASPAGMIGTERTTGASLENWSANAFLKQLAIDPERGRLRFLDGAVDETEVSVTYHYGFSAPIGAGTFARPGVEASNPTVPSKSGGGPLLATDLSDNGIVQLDDSKTYGPVADVLTVQNLTLQAANPQRPYLRLESDWILQTPANQDAQLVLDGLWIGNAGDETFEIILRGDYECVTLRHCTLDPGGDVNALGETLHPLSLIVEGFVEKLCLESCILGPIATRNNGLVEKVVIRDSILQSVVDTVPAMHITSGKVDMECVTVFGEMQAHRLYASEVIVTGRATVTDTQTGCFRFSAAPVGSRLPRPYESFLFPSDTNHWFSSRKFGQPNYAQLSETAPGDLRTGAENGSEMGAFSRWMAPIKQAGLRAKIDEYMPFGLIPAFINET